MKTIAMVLLTTMLGLSGCGKDEPTPAKPPMANPPGAPVTPAPEAPKDTPAPTPTPSPTPEPKLAPTPAPAKDAVNYGTYSNVSGEGAAQVTARWILREDGTATTTIETSLLGVQKMDYPKEHTDVLRKSVFEFSADGRTLTAYGKTFQK